MTLRQGSGQAAPISKGQIRAIHTLIHRIGIDDDLYRMMLSQRFNVRSSTALSSDQARGFLDELNDKLRGTVGQRRTTIGGSRRPYRWPAPTRADRPGATISAKQQGYLDRLFANLGWEQVRRDGFCRKVIGRAWPQTNQEVTRLLNLLRAMGQRYPGGYDRARERRQT